jgi:hypothetical protein
VIRLTRRPRRTRRTAAPAAMSPPGRLGRVTTRPRAGCRAGRARRSAPGRGRPAPAPACRARRPPWPAPAPMPGDVRVPALQAVRVLRASWRPAPVAMRITSGTAELPARHVRAARRVVHDLVERQQAEVDRHHSTMGRRPPSAAPMPAPTKPSSDSGVSRMRSGPNSSSRPLLTRVAAAVAADVLAHQEHRAGRRCSASRMACRRPRGRSSRGGGHGAPRCEHDRPDRAGVLLHGIAARSAQVLHRLPGAGLGEGHRGVDLGGPRRRSRGIGVGRSAASAFSRAVKV